MDLNTTVKLYRSLLEFLHDQRSEFDFYEQRGKIRSGNSNYKQHAQRKRKQRREFDEGAAVNTELSPSSRFKTQVFFVILDRLQCELQQRLKAYDGLEHIFGFLRSLESADAAEIRLSSSRLEKKYATDIENTLPEELLHFSAFLKASKLHENDVDNRQPELQMYLTIVDNELHSTFPNVLTVLKIFLCLMVTNCTGERSFSTLKRVKSSLRSTMGDTRLNNLCIMCIESQILRTIDFHDIIADFARKKARKVKCS
jgi:hypothetical protein